MSGQRHPLYDAEDDVIGPVAWYASVAGAQFDVDRFIRRKWWRERSPVVRVDMIYPVNGTGAVRVSDTHWRLEFSPKALCDLNVCHELAHVLMGATTGTSTEDHEADHSAHFAGAELAIIRRFISADISRVVQRAFDEAGVAYVLLPTAPPAQALDTTQEEA